METKRFALVLSSLTLLATSAVYAESPAGDAAAAVAPPAAAENRDAVKKRDKYRAKGRPSREKEAEGTKAADRFEATTVIKSKYHLNGQPLEVDPD